MDNRPLLERQPEMAAGKFAKMARGPYPFFRATLSVFLADAARPGPLWQRTAYGSGPASRVWVLGDPHPENIGSVRDAAGTMAVEFNDFDGATFGPYHLDVRRLALGFHLLATRAGLTAADRAEVVQAVGRGYVDGVAALRRGAPPVRIRPEAGFGVIFDDLLRRATLDGEAGEALDEYTVLIDGRREMYFGHVEDPIDGFPEDTVVPLVPAEEAMLLRALASYPSTLYRPRPAAEFALKGTSRRLGVGVSSYPLQRWYALVEGPSTAPEDDVLLEFKEAGDPARYPRLDRAPQRAFGSNGERAVLAQRSWHETAASDPFLGWAVVAPMSMRVRQRTKFQKGVQVERIAEMVAGGTWGAADVTRFAQIAGALLARGHCLSPTLDGRSGLSVIDAALRGDPAGFVGEVVEFVEAYAPIIAADYARFLALRADVGPTLGYRRSR